MSILCSPRCLGRRGVSVPVVRGSAERHHLLYRFCSTLAETEISSIKECKLIKVDLNINQHGPRLKSMD